MIPFNLYMTAKALEKVPSKVFERWLKLNPGLTLKFYDDDQCVDFLRANFTEKHVEVFQNLVMGPLKADFFRYCVLYHYGGIYMDIDLVPYVSISEMIPDFQNYDFFTCIGASQVNNNIFQAILGCTKGHWFMECNIKMYLDFAEGLKTPKVQEDLRNKEFQTYWSIAGANNMKILLKTFFGDENIKPGKVLLRQNQLSMSSYFLLEKFPENDSTRWTECLVYNGDKVVAKSRDDDYDVDNHTF